MGVATVGVREEASCTGDRVLTDAWAVELGLRNWYEWRRLDAVREPRYRGDKRVIDSWADCFGLRGRYEWRPLFEKEC